MFQAILVRPVIVILRSLVIATGLIAAVMAAEPTPAEPVQFKIAEQALASALTEFARQSDRELLFATDIVEGKQAQTVAGVYEPEEALSQLLAATGLEYSVTANDTILVAEEERGDSHSGNARQTTQPVLMTQNQTAEPPSRRANEGERENSGEKDTKPLEEIVVTGTLIRGIAPESSPLRVYSREQILESGVATTEQFIRTLPQNHGGGSTEFSISGFPNDSTSSNNFALGSSANLRGLGSSGTLTLLNGLRLAPSSAVGDFVDLSLIPLSAIDRIDVLTDGSSSIYGGDAVGGVVNFVTRRDFEGAETSLRYGAVTEGSLSELRISQTVGAQWQSGSVLGVYEYFDRGDLSLADKPDIEGPLPPIEGTTIPLDQYNLIPSQRRNSVLVSLNQDIAPQLSVSSAVMYSKRNAEFVNLITPSISDRRKSSTDVLSVGTELTYQVSDVWSMSALGSLSNSTTANDRVFSFTSSPFHSDIHSKYRSADLILRGDLGRLPGGVAKLALGGQYRDERFSFVFNDESVREGGRSVRALFGEINIPLFGSDNETPGISVLEANVSARLDDYSDFGTTINPKIGIVWSPVSGLFFRGSYGTSFAPPALGRVGDQATGATVNPTSFITGALGISGQYPELEATNIISVTGNARDLQPELSESFTFGSTFKGSSDRSTYEVNVGYYNIKFKDRLGEVPIPGNVLRDFAPFIYYDDPSAFPDGTIILFPTDEQVQAVIASVNEVQLLRGATLDNFGIIDRSYLTRNLAETRTSGIDVSVDNRFDIGDWELFAGLSATKIIEFTQQAAETTSAIDIVDTLYKPLDLKIRANIGFSFGQFTSSIFVNYLDDYKVDSSNGSERIGSMTTVDVNARINLENSDSMVLNGLSIGLNVSNLFDVGPPVAPTFSGLGIAGYDPANASPIGRFVAFEVRKAF